MKRCLVLLATSLVVTTLCASRQPATITHSAHEQPMLSADQAWASVVAGKLAIVDAEYQLESGDGVRLNTPSGAQN